MVQTMFGTGRFLDPHTVEITLSDGDIRTVSGDKIMIAVGTRPYSDRRAVHRHRRARQ
jgi:NAD(P) transhydrogenase